MSARKRKVHSLESLQQGLTPEQFYMDEEGIAADLLQDKVRGFACQAAWGNMLTNELWNIINSDKDIIKEMVHKLEQKDSVLYITLNLDAPFLNKGGSPLDSLALHLIGYREKNSYFEKGSQQERASYRDFCEDLLNKGIVKDPKVKLGQLKDEIKSYKNELKEYLKGGVRKSSNGTEFYKFGWNEAETLVQQEVINLELAMYKLMKPFYEMAKAQEKGGLDIRSASKRFEQTNGVTVKEINKRYDEMFSQYLKWHELKEAIYLFRESDITFKESLWDVFDDKFSTKQLNINSRGKIKELKTIHPTQEQIIHPIISFTNGIEDKSLPLEQRSGITINDPGVKTYTSYKRKVESPRCNGDPSQIMDLLRLTFSCEKMMGVGFLVNRSLKPILARNNIPSIFEPWKTTTSLFSSAKVNASIGFEESEISQIREEYGINIVVGTRRGAEMKVANSEQLRVKRKIADSIFHLRREMREEQADGSYKMLEADDPENYGRVEYIRLRFKNILKNSEVKEALEKFKIDITLPGKEDFRHQIIFDDVFDKLDMLEKHLNAFAISGSHYSFKRFSCALNKKEMEAGHISSGDFAVYRKALTNAEMIQIERDLSGRYRASPTRHGR